VAISKAGRRFLAVHRRGELLGEMGAFDNAPRSASVQATTDTVCLATDLRLVESLPGTERMAFGYVLYRIVAAILAERLRETTRVLMGGQPRRRRNPLRWLIAMSGRG
jgi:CRP-like cAMP-binding protein